MTNYAPDEQLVKILRDVNNADLKQIPDIKTRHRNYLSSVNPLDLAFAVQELVSKGEQFNVIENNIEEHIKLLDAPLRKLYEQSMSSSDILEKLAAEHRQVDYWLGENERLCFDLDRISWLSPASEEYKKLVQIAEHVYASSKHTDIEEEIIFSALEQLGITVIPRLLRAQHFEIRYFCEQLYELAFNCCVREFTEIRSKFKEIGGRIAPLKRKHMLIEENLIYPIAVEVIDDQIWNEFRKKYEGIEFCLF